MAVQVLSPHQCLKSLPTFVQRTPLSPLMTYRSQSNPNNQANIPSQPDFWKQQKPSRANNTNSLPAKNQHKIKKLGGESIKAAAPHQKVQEARFYYAGSCTSSASPPPSSLPVPSFLAKK